MWIHEISKKATSHLFFGIGVLAVSIYSFISFGLLGVGRNGEAFPDVKYWYTSGKLWLSGSNPYDHDIFQKLATALDLGEVIPFAYPPQSFSFSGFLGVFPYEVAKVVWAVINVLSVVLLVYFSLQEIRIREARGKVSASQLALFLVPAIIIGNPITTTVVWLGQTTIVVTAALIYSFKLIEGKRYLVAGVLIGFATVKPQLAFLVVLWLILDKRWVTLLAAAGSILVFSIVPIMISGLFGVLTNWLSAMNLYQSHEAISSGLSYNTNVKSLLVGFGFDLPSYSLIAFMTIGIGLTFTLWMLKRKKKVDSQDILGILLGLSLLFFFGRDYDLVALVPALSSIWWHVRSNLLEKFFSLSLCCLLFLPHRLMELVDIPFLLYWRIVVLMIIVIFLSYLSLRSCRFEQEGRLTSA